jgi:hypothetical protein
MRKGSRIGMPNVDRWQCIHTQFNHCPSCGKNGIYYFGDEILKEVSAQRRGSYTKRTRAEILESVLEAIEDNYLDGMVFSQYDLLAGQWWGSRVYQALRWLEHLGLIERTNPRRKHKNTKNLWRVKDNGQSASNHDHLDDRAHTDSQNG